MTTTTRTNNVTVFTAGAWTNPAPGIWEATARPISLDGPPPFEAVIIANTGTGHRWHWSLYEPLADEPHNINDTTALAQVAEGQAPTLASAKRQADHAARQWRDLDDPPHQSLGRR